MVGAISGPSTLTTSTTSASTSTSTDTATLKAQLAAKQTALEQAKTDDEKTKLNTEITTLKAQIAAADSQSSQQTSNANAKTDGSDAKRPRWEESRPPEGKISSAVMSVLMQLSQGGMAPPDGDVESGERPSAADLYTKMDSDKDGSVTKSEFVAARPEHATEEEATSFYNSIDTKGTGSITEQQLADSMKDKGGPGGPEGRHMGPPGGAPDMASQDVALQQLLASLSASAEAEAKVA